MLGRSQDAYDRFSAAVDGPLTILAVLWVPVLVVPLVIKVSPATSDALDSVDYVRLDRIEAALARLTPNDNDQPLRCIR
jgi:hypothetical protein